MSFRNAYPYIWVECKKIHLNILLKFGDKWSRKNLQPWYTVGSVRNTRFRLNAKATFR